MPACRPGAGRLLALSILAWAAIATGFGPTDARAAAPVIASPATCGPALGVCPAAVTLGLGSWCWFADPRAVHIDRDGIDEVVVGWLSPKGRVMLESIDAAGHAATVVVSHTFPDDHNSPAISVEPDNRITVYWSAHDGRHLFYRTTRKPGDITSWQHYQALSSNTAGRRGFTYPNPVILSAQDNLHYLFWRGGDWEPTYATRTDAGTWSRARRLINDPRRRPYMKVASNGVDRIALAFTNGHPDNNVTSIFYAEIRGAAIYSAAGRRLGRLGGAPIRPSAATAVYDARANHNVRSWLQDVALDKYGRPAIVYSTYPRRGAAQYWYARWNGHRWLRHFMVDAGPSIEAHQPHYLGGAVLDHARAGIVYISTMAGAHHQIQRWVTDDGGHSWSFAPVTTGTASEVRPVVAQEMPGARGPASTIFALRGVYHSYWHYRTSVVMLSSRFSVTGPASASVGSPSD